MPLPRTIFALMVWTIAAHWIASEAQETRIPAYRNQNKPVVRIIPSHSVLIRLRKPDSSKPGLVGLSESNVTRIQPILLTPRVTPQVSLRDVLLQMRLHHMASLIERAKLQKLLQGAGSITLFAPTDEAFSMVSPPEDFTRLRDFVLQHVVKGRISPQDLRNDITLPSLRSGSRPLRFNVYDDGQLLSVSGSQFLDDARDVGSIRVQPIDRVLYPISNEDLVTEVRLTFPRMYEFLLNSSLTSQLTSGTFTLFAPTDAAFEALSSDVRQKLFHNPTLMRKVLLNHVVPGTHYSAVLAHGYSLRSLGGEPIFFTNRRGLILANGMPLVKSDISVTNGVIHAVNRMLLPPELHARRKPATMAPAPRRPFSPAPPPQNMYTPVPTFMEPAPSVPRSLTKTMSTPLQLPDGDKVTFQAANSLFRRSLLMTNLRNNATDDGFTIIMPTDGAFDMLQPGSLDRLRRNTRLLRRMLLNQMIEGKLDLSDPEQRRDRPIRSLGGTIVISSLDDGKSLMAGGARILSVRPASNGMVLVTDRVSFPPPARTVVEALKPMVILKGVVQRHPAIRTTLTSDEAAYTIFAPTDQALSALPEDKQKDPRFLSELFWSHIVVGAYYRSRLTPGLQLMTLRGKTINVQRTPSGTILVNNVPLSGEEILAGNGVVHKIDSILFAPGLPQLPPKVDLSTSLAAPEPEDELAEIAREFNATNFLQWMNKAQMRNVLQSQPFDRGCTLFLPTNAALNAMSPTLRSVTLGDLRRLQKLIRYHLSPRPLRWNSILDNELLLTMVPGKQIRCNIYNKYGQPSLLSVSGCRVIGMKPLRRNQNVTIAVIEGTMSPPAGNLLLTASKSPLLSNFSKILKVAGAEEIFANGGPYTLFAPNRCVFSKMDSERYQQLITNRKLAREFVKRYIVKGCYYSNGFYDGQVLVTEAGTELTVKVTPECILVSGVRILYGDMSSTDGVLHVVAEPFPS